jgi:hypothetical protein
LKTKVTLRLRCDEGSVARTTLASLNPDDKFPPKGMRIRSHTSSNRLHYTITSNGGLDTVAATVDEILADVSLVLETLKQAK